MLDSKLLWAAAAGAATAIFADRVLSALLAKMNGPASAGIERLGTKDPRASAIVVHNGVVYVSGQVGDIEKLAESDIAEQTRQTLAKIEILLAQVGIKKDRILESRIWVKDIKRDFAAMNEVWNAWVDPDNKGTRFCVEANMARPTILVEIQVVAAL